MGWIHKTAVLSLSPFASVLLPSQITFQGGILFLSHHLKISILLGKKPTVPTSYLHLFGKM